MVGAQMLFELFSLMVLGPHLQATLGPRFGAPSVPPADLRTAIIN